MSLRFRVWPARRPPRRDDPRGCTDWYTRVSRMGQVYAPDSPASEESAVGMGNARLHLMRGLLLLVVTLSAAVAAAEESSRRQEPRAAMLEALEVQASLPASLPELPEAASPVAESAREAATEGARRGQGARTRGEPTEKARREASERASSMAERTPPGASIQAARDAALGAAGVGSEAQDAAGRSRSEKVRKDRESRPEGPGSGKPTQPAPIRNP